MFGLILAVCFVSGAYSTLSQNRFRFPETTTPTHNANTHDRARTEGQEDAFHIFIIIVASAGIGGSFGVFQHLLGLSVAADGRLPASLRLARLIFFLVTFLPSACFFAYATGATAASAQGRMIFFPVACFVAFAVGRHFVVHGPGSSFSRMANATPL
jgi:hypothetical protein